MRVPLQLSRLPPPARRQSRFQLTMRFCRTRVISARAANVFKGFGDYRPAGGQNLVHEPVVLFGILIHSLRFQRRPPSCPWLCSFCGGQRYLTPRASPLKIKLREKFHLPNLLSPPPYWLVRTTAMSANNFHCPEDRASRADPGFASAEKDLPSHRGSRCSGFLCPQQCFPCQV